MKNTMNDSSIFRPNRLIRYDEASIVAEIQRVVTTHFAGKPPTKENFDKHSRVKSWLIRKRFGSWAEGIRRAGYAWDGKNYDQIDLRSHRYTKLLMISDLQNIKNTNGGQYFSQEFYKSNGGKYSVKTLKKYFECTWEFLLKDHLFLPKPADLRLKVHHVLRKCASDYSEACLLAEMKRVWDVLGRRPSYSEFREKSTIGTKIYERTYGSWTRAVEAYFLREGSDHHGLAGSNATDRILLNELDKTAKKAGSDILTYKKYIEHGGVYSIGTFQSHFGSWKIAVSKIGHRDGHSGKYTDESLFLEMQRLWEKLGKQPTFRDMDVYGLISGKVFQKRFGSWMAAVHAFCDDRQSEQEEAAPLEMEPEADVKSTSISIEVEKSPLLPPDVVAITETTVLVDARRVAGPRLRFRVFQRDRFKCVFCGSSPDQDGVKLQADHVIPWSRGGLTVLENLRTACAECNVGKADLLV